MGEPARKYQQDIEPDLRPNLRVLEGGGETTPERANLELVKDPDDNIEKIKNDEENTNPGWENKYTGQKKDLEDKLERRRQLGRGYRALGKNPLTARLIRKGPLTTIIFTVIGGGIGLSTLFSPGLLIVHMKETMVNKFNVQLTSMDVRTTKILKSKTVGGLLCNTFNKCRYQSMSNKQVAKFEKAGIKVVFDPDGKTNLLGRKNIASFEFEGKPISPNEFNDLIKSDPKFRSAVKKAYNSKFAGFVDSIWDKISAKFNVSKATAEIAGETDEMRLKSIQDATSTGNKAVEPDEVYRQGAGPEKEMGDPADPTRHWSVEEANQANDSVIRAANYPAAAVNEGANEVFETGTKAGTGAAEVAESALESGKLQIPESSYLNVIPDDFKEIENMTKVTGILDNACTIYRMVQALGYAAKTVRAVQLARYAMLFLNVADQIKAGDANPDDVSYLGKILTTEIGGTMALKSATDSFGYKFAAYGEIGKMSTTASQFLAGGGLPGKLIGLTNTINSVLGSTPRATCKLLGNTFISLGSAAAGIAMMFMPMAGPVVFTAKTIAFGVAGLAFQVGMMYLPELLKDIVAGVLVDETTVGEAAGDAYTSGASGIMGSLAQRGGNAPLTPAEAVAYNNLSNEVIAQYAEEDRLAYSPFDITNGNTFMGKIFAQLIPYASNMSSLSGILTSIASIPTRSLAMATSQNAMATSSIEDYQLCPDMDYNNLNDSGAKLATDPYCNVMYGIPVGALDTDPLEVVDALESEGQLNPDGSIMTGSDYEKFVTDCIARDRPLGDQGADFSLSDGSECLFNDENKNYYLYYIDQRVLSGMEGEPMAIDPETTPAEDSIDNGGTEMSDANKQALIDKIIASGNVTYWGFSSAANGNVSLPVNDSHFKDSNGNIAVDGGILQFLASLSETNHKFTITSLLREDDSDSQHSIGRAVDIAIVDEKNIAEGTGKPDSEHINFVTIAALILGGIEGNSNCSIGVPGSATVGTSSVGIPNSYYKNAVGTNCDNVFYDQGSGGHLHFALDGAGNISSSGSGAGSGSADSGATGTTSEATQEFAKIIVTNKGATLNGEYLTLDDLENVHPIIIEVLAELLTDNHTFEISSLEERAVNIYYMDNKQADYSEDGGHNSIIEAFISRTASLLPDGSYIGIPNETYDNLEEEYKTIFFYEYPGNLRIAVGTGQ